MIKCSACVLTYNNERTLEKCLESAKDFSDIVILDGGSSDKTLEIAQRYNARIFPQGAASGAIENFTSVREKLFSLAREDWRLWLDSDEWLSEEMRKDIARITAAEGSDVLYSFGSKIVIAGKVINYAYFYPLRYKRLFNKNSDISWSRRKKVHEKLVVGPKSVTKDSPAIFYHDWSKGYGDFIKKDDHYLSLTVQGKENLRFSKKLWIAMINILKAAKVFLKSFLIYLRHGFKDALPVAFSWRFIRYHLIYAKKILMSKPKICHQ